MVTFKPRKRASSGTNTAAGWRKWNTGERRRHELNLGCYGRARHTHARQKRTGWSQAISHSDDKPSRVAAGRKTTEVQLSADKSELRFQKKNARVRDRYRRKEKNFAAENTEFHFYGGPCCKGLCPEDIIAVKRIQMFLNSIRNIFGLKESK